MKRITCIFCIFLFLSFHFGACAQGETIFFDGFESRTLSSTNADGFTWASPNRTSLVSGGPSTNEVVYPSHIIVHDSRDWSAKDGNISLRFRYPAGANMSEQRFFLGKHYKNIWISYWIRVPTNFVHGSLNNKFLALWVGSDGYDTFGDVTWQTRPDGKGGALLVYQDGGVLRSEADPTPFISVPEDRGRWMQVAIHIKSASAPDAEDGAIQFYRRWEGESSWELIHNNQNADTWRNWTGPQGISHGYLMGWANDSYDKNTEWLIDDFVVSTDSLVVSSGSDNVPPSAPANLRKTAQL